MRSGASVCHERAFSVEPRGARIDERSPTSRSTMRVAHESPFRLVGRPFAFPFPSGAPTGAARLSRCRKRNQLHPVARTK